MKALRILAILVAAVSLSFGAHAEKIFRFGPKVGTEINSMRLDKSVFDSENRAGFTGGLMFEANVPVIGISVDLSVMYVHRIAKSGINTDGLKDPQIMDQMNSLKDISRDYIEIPLHLKYRLGLPIVGKYVAPYIFTGPSFGILASKKAITEAYNSKSFDVSWNFGLGVQLFSHLQLGASYGLGITKTLEKVSSISAGPEISGRNNYWTVTAAWLF